MTPQPPARIIAVSQSPDLRRRLERLWSKGDVLVDWEADMDRVLSRFEDEVFDVLLVTSAAFQSGKADGLELLEVVIAKSSSTQILFLASEDDLNMAMSALKAGSYHYARTPVSDRELRMLIETAFGQRPHYGSNQLLKSELEKGGSNLVGESPAMQAVFQEIEQAAATDIPVLIEGETGTGKDQVAQTIHLRSPRSAQPFAPVNIGALPTDLVGSELFGYERGAFTGAQGNRAGRFEQAHGGTIFLDEIGAIDERVQVSLLRLIEQKKFHRLGGNQLITTDVRLIAATNENLADMVQMGRFREDLFFRLDVFRIHLPPLRERTGDVPLLIETFLERYNRTFKKNILRISPEFMRLCETYAWPGNVRELKNAMQRAVLICDSARLTPQHLPRRVQQAGKRDATVAFHVGTPLSEMEREMIVQTLQATDNNRTRTAELLDISRRALYYKMRKYEIL